MPSFLFTVLGLALIFGLSMIIATHRQKRRLQNAPRITTAEFDSLLARLEKATLPVAWATLTHDSAPTATGSRIGGPPFIDSVRRKWPLREGLPMLFLGQINFAEVPPLEDFPRQGLLQVFVLVGERGEIGITERKTDRVIRWFPDPKGDLTLRPPDSLAQSRRRRTFSPHAVKDGLAMTFRAGEMAADPCNWPYSESYPSLDRRLAESEELRQRIDDWERKDETGTEAKAGKTWIGGHPSFVQDDVRHEPRLRKLNRVLLHLSSDMEDICLADAGELNLMISRKALRAATFDEAYCTWDCG